MSVRPLRVLFVCTRNSARSIIAEALLRGRGGDAFEVRSAGVDPGQVHPLAIAVLEEAGLPTGELRSESVDAYLGEPFDEVITVCDSAARVCPVFPGEGRRRHWGEEDPAAVAGTEEERLAAFRRVRDALAGRIDAFLAESGAGPREPIRSG